MNLYGFLLLVYFLCFFTSLSKKNDKNDSSKCLLLCCVETNYSVQFEMTFSTICLFLASTFWSNCIHK